MLIFFKNAADETNIIHLFDPFAYHCSIGTLIALWICPMIAFMTSTISTLQAFQDKVATEEF